jgi:hypothetical protein
VFICFSCELCRLIECEETLKNLQPNFLKNDYKLYLEFNNIYLPPPHGDDDSSSRINLFKGE